MPFSDLDSQLQQLGYGSQWGQVQQKIALRVAKINVSDLQRVKQHNKRFPQKHRQAKARWARDRFQAVKDRVGNQKCQRCFAVMQSKDLIGENRLLGHCKKCRKELLG